MAVSQPDWEKTVTEFGPRRSVRGPPHRGRRAITHIAHISTQGTQQAALATADQPRAVGRAMVSSKRRADGCIALDGLRQSGALKLLFPQGRPPVEAVMVNTAGGITGGDRFAVAATAGADSQLTLTTQAAERVYRAQPDQTGEMITTLDVAGGARLNWLPQETILFQTSSYRRSLRAELAADARLLLVEPLVLGRAAMGEQLTAAQFCDRIEIFRAGRRVYHDAIRLHGDIAAQMARPGLAGVLSAPCGAMATLVLAAPEAEGALDWIRSALPAGGTALGGASLLAADLLHLRLLATDSFVLRQSLLPILDRLTNGGLPRCWRL